MVYYLGFALLVISLLISQIKTTLDIAASSEASDIHQVFYNLMESTDLFMGYFTLFVLIFAVVLIVSNIILLVREGIHVIYFVDIGIALLLIFGEWVLFQEADSEINMVAAVIQFVCLALYLYFECMIIGVAVAITIAAKKRPGNDRDYLIILGCGLNDDGTPAPILPAAAYFLL